MQRPVIIRSIIAGIFLLLYGGVFLFLLTNIQNPDALFASVEKLYAQYGVLLVFVVSLLEGIFLLGSYVPGTAVILFSAAFARTGAVSLPLVILSGAGGLVCGYSISYMLGRYGWYQVLASFGLLSRLDKSKKMLEKYEQRTLFFGFLSTFVAALLATSAGIMRLRFRRFFVITLLSQLFWTTLWSGITYLFGELIVENIIRSVVVLVIVVVAAWIIRWRLRHQPTK